MELEIKQLFDEVSTAVNRGISNGVSLHAAHFILNQIDSAVKTELEYRLRQELAEKEEERRAKEGES